MGAFVVLVVTLFSFIIYSVIRSTRKPPNYPPGPRFFPWLGNTMQLRLEARQVGGQHILFEKWAEKYKSNIIGLKLGKDYVIVVLSYPLVRQVHLNETFEGRPDNFFLRLRTLGTRMGITCTDGKLWYEHRTFVMKQLRHVGYGRTPMEIHIKQEAEDLVDYISQLNAVEVWPGSFLAASVISVLWSLTSGQRIQRNDKRLEILLSLLNRRSKLFDLCGGILTQLPWLRFIAPNKTGYNLIRELNKELHGFIMDSINEHKLTYSKEREETDFIYAYIKEMTLHNKKNSSFNDTQLTMTILDLFIAGSQTTSTTIDLALMIMAIRTDIQEKIFNEIRANLGNDEFPYLSSRSKLPYMNAFIMEVQRFFHITPITGPRRALWETELCGYRIPKNATILISLRSVLMDKVHWKHSEKFRPERFLDIDQSLINDEFFIPFGQGRRRCLGDTLAKSCIFSFLCKIVQNFHLKAPSHSTLCTTLLPGITLSPKPYKIVFVKRS